MGRLCAEQGADSSRISLRCSFYTVCNTRFVIYTALDMFSDDFPFRKRYLYLGIGMLFSVLCSAYFGGPFGGENSRRQSMSADSSNQITVYRTESCFCCGRWVDHLEEDGFTVEVVYQSQEDLLKEKSKKGIPEKVRACHTAVINGYVVEGHVPAQDIQKMIETKPKARGISVPGMPAGSPGMDAGEEEEPYAVFTFDSTGVRSIFARYNTDERMLLPPPDKPESGLSTGDGVSGKEGLNP